MVLCWRPWALAFDASIELRSFLRVRIARSSMIEARVCVIMAFPERSLGALHLRREQEFQLSELIPPGWNCVTMEVRWFDRHLLSR